MARSLGVHPDTLSQWEQGGPLGPFGQWSWLPEYWGWQNQYKDEEATRGGRVVRCREEYALHHG